MGATRRAARAGRTLLVALLLGALIIAAIVAAYVLGGRNASTPRAAGSSASPTAATPSSSDADSAPTGCLAGPGDDTATMLAVQRRAGSGPYGAVEVAASFFRWAYRYPVPSNAEITSAQGIFVKADAARAIAALKADYASNPNPSNGSLPAGTRFDLSTVDGVWTVASGTGSDIRVEVQASLVVNGAVSPTKTAAESFDMRFEKGAWHVERVAGADTDVLASGGTRFTAGC